MNKNILSFKVTSYLSKVTTSQHSHTPKVLETEVELLFFPG